MNKKCFVLFLLMSRCRSLAIALYLAGKNCSGWELKGKVFSMKQYNMLYNYSLKREVQT